MQEPLPDKLNRLGAAIPAAEAAESIYREKGIVALVRLESIRIDEWGVRAVAVPVPAPGLIGPERPWPFDAAWEVFSFDGGHWSAMYGGWVVFFDPEVVCAV